LHVAYGDAPVATMKAACHASSPIRLEASLSTL
jgi:hypothetical protein